MEYNKNYFTVKGKFIALIHRVVLVAMLHSTFVAPAQGIINAYINKRDRHTIYSYTDGSKNLPEIINQSATLGQKPYANLNPSFIKQVQPAIYDNVNRVLKKILPADLKEGIIGISQEMPIDNPADNLFKVTINDLPTLNSKVYITYELYGLNDHQSVARSINERLSTGGYLIKAQPGWSVQKEEIDVAWLKKGQNTILFTVPDGANYLYKIRNLTLEIEQTAQVNPLMVLPNRSILLSKDNKIYVKGFLRGDNSDAKIYAGDVQLNITNNEFEGIVPITDAIKINKFIVVKALNKEGLLGQELLFIDNITEADNAFKIEDKQLNFSKFFKANSNESLQTEGASLVLNDSALVTDKTLSVTKLRGIDIPPMESGMINVTKGASAYRFLPDGTQFNAPVTIGIAYDTLLLPTGYTPKDIKTYFFDTDSKSWKVVQLDSIDNKNFKIISKTTHFTDYINGIIQSPDSPETSAFMPNMMNDIKAADPSAEMTLISPPQASQKGDANISYPIKIPAGRKGMQPQVNLQYSNNGGSGWLGQGWNISTPAITIDTRWGVPSFDPVNESELYSLNGEQLMYPSDFLPHRHKISTIDNITPVPQTQARSANKKFTLRKEGSFAKIERKGNSPSNYYWKVTATDGTISWYGGYVDDDVLENTVIKDSSGRIVHWALYMVEDVFGNNIIYEYDNANITGLTGQNAVLNGSNTFYIKNIYYTGRNAGHGKYQVAFNYALTGSAKTIRTDATFTARLGLKQADPYVLNNIDIKYNTTLIRSYLFAYDPGAFSKRLLKSVTEKDKNNVIFHAHTFDYYDDVATNGGRLFKADQTVSTPTISADYSLEFGNLLHASKINSAQSTETGYSIKPSVGIEIWPLRSTNRPDRTLLVGAPFGENNVKSRGKVTLVDVDGDGIDDIVYKTNNGLQYYPGRITISSQGVRTNSFASVSKSMHNISDFSFTKANTKTIFGDSWDVTFLNFFAGTERTKSKSESTIYFTDANSDGLMDIVNNGVVNFNRIDTATGEPTFTSNSNVTPNMVLSGISPVGEPGPSVQETEIDEPEEEEEFNDSYDVVKVWMAPATGQIKIDATFINESAGSANFTLEHFHNGTVSLLRSATITNSYTLPLPQDPSSGLLNVTTGDRLYFRFHNNKNMANPIVNTDVTIYFLTYDNPYLEYTNRPDYYPPQDHFSNRRSFTIKDNNPVSMPGSGTVSITWEEFYAACYNQFADCDNMYQIFKRTTNAQGVNTDVLIYPLSNPQIPWGDEALISPTADLINIPVTDPTTSFLFKISDEGAFYFGTLDAASSNDNPIFFNDSWEPKLTFVPDSDNLNNSSGFTIYPIPEVPMYRIASLKRNFCLLPPATDPTHPTWNPPATADNYWVKPNIEIIDNTALSSIDNGSFNFMVYQDYRIRKVTITSGVISIDSAEPFFLHYGTTNSAYLRNLEFYYFVDKENIELFEKYRQAVGNKLAVIGYQSNPSDTMKTEAVSVYYKNEFENFGYMQNGWGQFMYNDEYDTNANTPAGAFSSKLINDQLVTQPFDTTDIRNNNPLFNTGCDPAASNYEQCVQNYLATFGNIPAEGSTIDPANVDTIIQNVQPISDNLPFNMAVLPLKHVRESYNYQEDTSYGLYNSQYIKYNKLRAGGRQDINPGSSSSGSGLSYPELTADAEPSQLLPNLSTGMKAINKIHRSVARSNSVGWSGGSGVGGVLSNSNSSYSHTVTDFVDLNGDGYPDIVTTDALQKTNMLGGHIAATANPGTGNITEEESSVTGLSGSRRYLLSGRKTGEFNISNKSGTSGDGTSQTKSGQYEAGPASSRIGLGINLAGSDKVNGYWLDINGDGLQDRVDDISGFKFQLNRGQNVFNSQDYISFNALGNIETTPGTASVNFGLADTAQALLGNSRFFGGGSVSGNAGYSASSGNTKSSYIDVNGDGLPDRVEGTTVKYNTGTGFGTATSLTVSGGTPLTLDSDSNSQALSLSGTVGAYIGFPLCCPLLPVLHIKFGGTFDATTSLSINQTKKIFKDIDGDGYVDFIKYSGNSAATDGNFSVNYSAIGRTNMLKTVKNPLGGSFVVDYEPSIKTYSDPNSHWVMKQLIVKDGYDRVNDGIDEYTKSFKYQGGYYDRREREFYGFAAVNTIDYTATAGQIYRVSVQSYHNSSYYVNGLLLETYVINAGQNFINKTTNTYQVKKMVNGAFDPTISTPIAYDKGGTEGRGSAVVLLTQTDNYVYELGSTPVASRVKMEYDTYARVVKYTYQGNVNDLSDDYRTDIEYHSSAALLTKNLINVPKKVSVYDTSSGTDIIKRERTTVVDESTGYVTSITAKIDGTNDAITDMKYDEYGNLAMITLPGNSTSTSERVVRNYNYDTVENKYLTKVVDGFNYASSTPFESSSTYDYNFDKVLVSTDISGNKMEYTYDASGRLKTILAPKEKAASLPYTISFTYNPLYVAGQGVTQANFMPFATTSHYDGDHAGNDIQTITFIDGLARVVQVKKDIETNTGSGVVEAMSISGKTMYDLYGRAIQQFHPYYEAKSSSINNAVNEYNSPNKVITNYDIADRVTNTQDPAGKMSYMYYSVVTNGTYPQLRTSTVTDQNATAIEQTNSYSDANGRIVKTENFLGNTAIKTSFVYNAIGELLTYTDDAGISTTYTYDFLGRKISLKHPDNGLTTYTYAPAGNITQLQTATLAANTAIQVADRFIKYKYNFNHLTEVNYPNTGANLNVANVKYDYGTAGNDKGRIVSQKDATGTQTFAYGSMGELVTNTRTVVGPNIPTRTFTTTFNYDSWNRIKNIGYPDGEKVTYQYDKGGNLNFVAGTMNGAAYPYVKDIQYDYYEQRTQLTYGNNTVTNYTYSADLRRMTNMVAKTPSGQNMFNNAYTYDYVGNIMGINNTAVPNTTNQMGGAYKNNYTYDTLNRLVSASGDFTGNTAQQANNNDFKANYSLAMVYKTTHGIEKKTQGHNKNNTAVAANTYTNNYTYIANTHKLQSINAGTATAENFTYDVNGNIKTKTAPSQNTRTFVWDESNRLRVTSDTQTMQHYIYDAGGERVLKATSLMSSVYENGTPVNSSISFSAYTTYPSAFIVVNSNGNYSKHYYAGSQRIVSRIGDQPITIFNSALPRTALQQDSSNSQSNNTESNNSESFDEDALRQLQIADLSQMLTKDKLGKATFKKYEPETNDKKEDATEKSLSTTAAALAPPPGNIYYYHPDHLGSSNYITDINGQPYQFYLNLPFGETMAEQHSLTEDYATPYKFNGKELDSETGLYYYGARYYDPRTSIWLSTDPLMEKYPNVNPYVYCVQNPINLIDPDGRDFITYLVYFVGLRKVAKLGFSGGTFNNAMRKFMGTSHGKNFVSQFMGKGDKAFGYTADSDGKYSDYKMLVFENAAKDGGERGAIMGTVAEAWFSARVNDGKLEFTMVIDGLYSEEKLVETIGHELLVHGDIVDLLVSKFKELGADGFQTWYADYQKNNENDHVAIRDNDTSHRGYKRYTESKNELIKRYRKFEEIFKIKDKFYKEKYAKYEKK
ncbi:hypothetical protein Q765_07580 [Flavobacterium rivuli WB 3.3-2 = DSM 21788]|uniref:Insecticide toxin TcdB middle/N-terminal domain-containing protein n=1 Tax=Flavobacterium rivuli WB 3.3-2 = DSM 21788 TaxID=1121895 RepID=A0A0A2M460_9FLAO|nr:SpvB/TcaC N-terminal domain-containing protein [Flavobacterium rivuli]KGO87064.1 hypothetical protein Q765_07580 [Flavobacterium rivuli WB 3.3-2 = DSM 21788]